ncbi:hypothetical protein I3271_05245 [Photobacterium leiognathi]|uniref:hypothetical protein n=1 Tax=Photobacterium leiognathi TaxID=553611 RepID=UPI001EDE9523|nr:hypothetical protein [Photobacterium leiognathi]MCG3884086.1 hypothetical protein [Photobacterium leiognathi]
MNVTALNGINASISKGDNYSIELNQTFHHLDSILDVQTFNFSYGYKLIGIDLQMNQLTGTKLSGDFFKEITVEKPKRYFKLELNDNFKLPINDEVLLKEVTITYPNGFSSTGTIKFKNKNNQTYIDFGLRAIMTLS